VRVTVGKKTLEDGAVDVRRRAGGADERIGRGDLTTWIKET
jgi:glycyl-tRNA synthetase (class II)